MYGLLHDCAVGLEKWVRQQVAVADLLVRNSVNQYFMLFWCFLTEYAGVVLIKRVFNVTDDRFQ